MAAEKPRELSVTEVDAIAEAGAGWCGEETFARLCRMARAIAVMERDKSGPQFMRTRWTAFDEDGFEWTAATSVEAIEAADAAGKDKP